MNLSLSLLATVVAAYLIGSLPFAVIVSRLFNLSDPRSFGSGNPGATNVLRTGNKLAALLTLLGDAGKGAVAILLARALASDIGLDEAGLALVALAAFLGHLYPVFLYFKGGKGVATAAGILLALSLPLGGLTLAVWLGTAFAFRYSSLAAIAAALAAPLLAAWQLGDGPLAWAVTGMAMLLVFRHQPNIRKLIRGEEGRIGGKKNSNSGKAT